MKAKSTTKREIRRLQTMAENDRYDNAGRTIAYEAYHILRWVIEDVSWTPHGEIGRLLQLIKIPDEIGGE
jgi:uncharacterized protein (DUF3820 family)